MHSKMRDSDFVAARYRRSLQSLRQSSVVGVSTLFVRKDIAVRTSGRVLWLMKRILATVE